jgi:hypothetical protein
MPVLIKTDAWLAPKIRKAEFFSASQGVGFYQVNSILRNQTPRPFKKQKACSSMEFIF